MQVMRRDARLHASLPETAVFSDDRFDALIRRYGSVILKPTYGSGGAGVMKATKLGHRKFIIRAGRRRIVCAGRQAAVTCLKRLAGGKPYVVQRYIPLASIAGRPLDFRVMVQRKHRGRWTVTGKVAKVAGAGHIITNVARSHGYVLPARTALSRSGLHKKAPAILARMNTIGLRAATQLGRAYGFRTIGFDMAVGRHGGTWILESNSRPALSLFCKLKDRSQYRRILRYK
jgi:hypothetical protein